jgi:hypothetical protein
MIKIRSESDLTAALAVQKLYPGINERLKTHCSNCSMPLSSENTHTREGWLATQFTGYCEDCYEDIVDNLVGTDD